MATQPASTAHRRGWLKGITGVLRYLVSFGLLGWILWKNRISFGQVLAHRPDPGLMCLAFALGLTGLLSTFIRWLVVVRAQGLTLRFRDAIRVGFMGNAVDLVIPGQIGGDVLKASFLGRGHERKTKAVASILVDRAIGILGLFTLAALMGALNWSEVSVPVRRVIAVVWVVWTGVALGLVAVLTPALFRPLEQRFAGRRRLGKLFAELHEISVAYRDRKLAVAAGLAMSTLSHGLNAMSFYAVSLALLPDPPSLLNNMLMVPLVLFSTVVPLPFGALGLSEQVSDDLFHLLGHPAGALAMLSYRVVALAVAGVSVVVYFLHSGEVAREPAELTA
jgi:uncharacterized protein (TIRG00374 family)